MRIHNRSRGWKTQANTVGLIMESQIISADQNRSKSATLSQAEGVSEVLFQLSRLLGKQAGMDFLRDSDILTKGGTE